MSRKTQCFVLCMLLLLAFLPTAVNAQCICYPSYSTIVYPSYQYAPSYSYVPAYNYGYYYQPAYEYVPWHNHSHVIVQPSTVVVDPPVAHRDVEPATELVPIADDPPAEPAPRRILTKAAYTESVRISYTENVWQEGGWVNVPNDPNRRIWEEGHMVKVRRWAWQIVNHPAKYEWVYPASPPPERESPRQTKEAIANR